MTRLLDDRIAVVTGASRGIGRDTAIALAKEGAHVVLIARTVGGLEEVDDEIQSQGGSATLVPLDLLDYEAIDRLGASLFERWGRLDILVGNAGILGKLMPLGHFEPKLWDQVMALNVTVNWRLIRSLDPLLRSAKAGRALFMTSGAAVNCRAYWGPYSVSKAALDALVKTYAAENATTNVCINLFNPGPVATTMRAQAMPGEDPSKLPTPAQIAEAVVPLVSDGCSENGSCFDYVSGEFAKR